MSMMPTIEQGLTVMFIGMGGVFTFLVILVITMHIMAKVMAFLNKLFPEVLPEQKVIKQKRQGKDDEEIAIAIAVAVRNM